MPGEIGEGSVVLSPKDLAREQVSKTDAKNLVTVVSFKQPAERAIPPGGNERNSNINSLEDEFQGGAKVNVSPSLDTLLTPTHEVDRRPSIILSLRQQFARLSRTRDLEINTDRTRVIQEGIDRMTAGTNVQTRVVIMNKGQQMEAFTMPDGTIFVSQSLINGLSTIDEIMAVMAHEVGHVVFKTSYQREKAHDSLERFGVGWTHEAACDLHTRTLLEKGRFNTLAFGSAIEKISGYERGTVHQGGLARAAQNVATHYFLDSSTSHLPQAEIPTGLKISDVRNTNLEIITEQVKTTSNEEFKEGLSKLHPGDLRDVFDYLKNHSGEAGVLEKMTEWKQLIGERLFEMGYSKGEAILTLVSLRQGTGAEGIPFFTNSADFESVVESLESFHGYPKRREIYEKLFASSFPNGFESPLDPLVNELYHNMDLDTGDPGKRRNRGIPVTEDSLINFIKSAQTLPSFAPYEQTRTYEIEHRGERLTRLVTRRIDMLTRNSKDEDVIIQQTRAFLVKARDSGVAISTKTFQHELFVEQSDPRQGIYNKIIQTYYEVYGIEREQDPGVDVIDKFFTELGQLKSQPERNSLDEVRLTLAFTNRFAQYFQEKKLPDTERAKFINYIGQKIDSSNFTTRTNLLAYLNGDQNITDTASNNTNPEYLNMQDSIIKFRLKTIMALQLFERDSPEFYQFVRQAMENSKLDTNELSKTQLFNLCVGLIDLGNLHPQLTIFTSARPESVGAKNVWFNNFGEMANLPFMETLLSRTEGLDEVNTIADLNAYTENLFKKIPMLHYYDHDNSVKVHQLNLFSDELGSLIIGKNIISKFEELVSKDVPTSQFDDLLSFIHNYYPDSTHKTQITRELNIRYLHAEDVSLREKEFFLIRNFNLIGPEGMVILADQIYDYETYVGFRRMMGGHLTSYLEGSNITAALGGADLLSSHVTNHWDGLLETTSEDPTTKESTSTAFANQWLETVDDVQRVGFNGIDYRKDQKKFAIGEKARQTFRSISDTITGLKDLTRLQRVGLSFKALTEHNGAFSSEENRKKLSTLFLKALDLKDTFIKSVLGTAILKADAKIITGPAAEMIGSRLFSSLDTDFINLKIVARTKPSASGYRHYGQSFDDMYGREGLEQITTADTRELTLFGIQYQNSPDSMAAKVAEASDQRYFSVTTRLKNILGIDQPTETQERTSGVEVDPALETIIRGVESSGPLGIRSLQLAVQFFNFSPEIHKRLSESFDSNPGMNKLVFWENLHKLAMDELEARNDTQTPNPKVLEFLKRIKLGKYLGGGSLQTTYSGEVTENGGEARKVILKRKNPTIYSIIQETYSNAKSVLEEVSQKGESFADREKARIGLMLIDLAQKWCIADINDTNFEVDDDLFKQTVDSFNEKIGFGTVYKPDRVFTDPKLKSEELASGRTANQLLNDDTVGAEVKRDVVESMSEFFLYQMRKQYTGPAGEKFYLVHSDPHVGNIMADVSGEDIKLGIIDRSMYLKLAEKDVKVLEKLIGGGNISDFAYSFVEHILDRNNIRGMDKLRLTGSILKGLSTEYAKQIVHGRVDKFALLQTLFSEFTKSKVHSIEVPLEMRLMIRNIASFQELTKRHDVNLEEVSRSLEFAA